MKRIYRLGLWLMLFGAAASAQQGKIYGIGATLIWPKLSCPAIVAGVVPAGPASIAGVRPGDQIVAIDGKSIRAIQPSELPGLLRSQDPGRVILTVRRSGIESDLSVQRESFSQIHEAELEALAKAGKKEVAGIIVPASTSAAELDHMRDFDGRRVVSRIFPRHYPTDPELFSGGFEVYVLRGPSEVAVGGVEDGPASSAGLHWGDVILSVNGIEATGKTPDELAALLGARTPEVVHLRISRLGAVRELQFTLEKTSVLLRNSNRKLVAGYLVPASLDDEGCRCLMDQQ